MGERFVFKETAINYALFLSPPPPFPPPPKKKTQKKPRNKTNISKVFLRRISAPENHSRRGFPAKRPGRSTIHAGAFNALPEVQLVRRLQSLRDHGRRTLHGLRQELALQFLVQIRRPRGVADIARRRQVLGGLHTVLHGQGVSGPMTTTTTSIAES